MEDPCLMSTSLDDLDSLPILGQLEQFLAQESERMRMSPDSTMHEAVNIQPPHSIRSDSSSNNDQIPDSTTSDLASSDLAYDSDAFNSEDSCSSFTEAQQISLSHHSLTAPSNANLLLFKSHHEDYNSSINFENRLPKKNAKKAKKAGDTLLKCEVCDYTTRFKEHLMSHMHKHAPDRNYMCQQCGQTFKWSHSLKRHQRTHAPSSDFRYTCQWCHKTFQRKDHLTIHEALHTSSESSFPCSECGATFKNKKTLTGHIKTHNTEKAFKCNQCDSEFTRKASLNRHERAAHAGHVLTCPLCPAVFSYRNTLEDHKKAAHNQGRRDYGCSLCGVQFAVKAYLSKHMITCRNRDSGISFACTLCSKSFPTKRHLHEHNKRKHPSSNEKQQQFSRPQPTIPTNNAQEVTSVTNIPTNNVSSRNLHSNPQNQHQVQPEQSFSTYDSNYYNYQSPLDPVESTEWIKNESNNPQLMGHDLPLPQMSTTPGSVMEEDHNVGSLLRLVYPGCPTDQLESSNADHHEFTVVDRLTGMSSSSQQHSQNIAHRPVHHNTHHSSDLMELCSTSAIPSAMPEFSFDCL